MRALGWIALAALLANAGAEPVEVPAQLAPGPDALLASLERAEQLLEESRAIGHATTRLQNAFGADRASGTVTCTMQATLSYGARAQVFGQAHRDRVQSASAEVDRLERLAAAPTVAPVVDAQLSARVSSARDRVDAEVRSVRVHAAWHERYILPRLLECRPPLRPAVGLAPWSPFEADGEQPVAVVGTRGGVICPSGARANGQVVVLEDSAACWDRDDRCYCRPEPVLDGAVLGESL